MLLKMYLFAYDPSQTSGRKIQSFNEEILLMKWLNQNIVFIYRTINRFRISLTIQTFIKQMYLTFNQQLQDQVLIGHQVLFVDGTKIGADANKYSCLAQRG